MHRHVEKQRHAGMIYCCSDNLVNERMDQDISAMLDMAKMENTENNSDLPFYSMPRGY